MQQKYNREELNSGRLFYGTKQTLRDKNKKFISSEFVESGKLYFKIKQFKFDDFKMYFGIDSKVDMKVKTYYVKDLSKNHLIRIDNDYYDIITIDVDSQKKYAYLYLQKRGGIDD